MEGKQEDVANEWNDGMSDSRLDPGTEEEKGHQCETVELYNQSQQFNEQHCTLQITLV